MIRIDYRFLKPNKELRELHALLVIEEKPFVSQHQLARELGISSAMANAYMKELVGSGRVAQQGLTNRTIQYRLTDAGRVRKSNLLLSSSIEIIQLYGQVKGEFGKRLFEIEATGARRIALFGAAETGEVVYAAARKTQLQVVAVVDSDPSRQGTAFGNLTVQSPRVLWETELDAILITSFACSDEIHRQVQELEQRGVQVFRL